MTPNIGDTVRYLNATGGGKIVRISGQLAYVDEDGFETPVLLRECVVVARAGQPEPRRDMLQSPRVAKVQTDSEPETASPVRPEPEPEEDIVETEGGDVLNVVLGFEATDLKNLSRSSFEAYLVNDSNYMLDYAVMTRADHDGKWTLRHRGTAEPNMQVFAFEFGSADLPAMDRIAVQLIACKTGDRQFALKPAIQIEQSIDTTRFARLHCFTRNEYFDNPVIALDVVRDDRVARAAKVDPQDLKQAMTEKRRIDHPVQRKPQPQRSKAGDVVETDLHATELFDNLNGLTNAEILNAQIDRFRAVMDKHLRTPGVKLIFIHGKGNGVLRDALMKELNHRYRGHEVQDASFREYGFGATQVTIRNIPRR